MAGAITITGLRSFKNQSGDLTLVSPDSTDRPINYWWAPRWWQDEVSTVYEACVRLNNSANNDQIYISCSENHPHLKVEWDGTSYTFDGDNKREHIDRIFVTTDSSLQSGTDYRVPLKGPIIQVGGSEGSSEGSSESSSGGSSGSSSGIVSSGLLMHLDAGNSSSYSGTGTTWSDLSGNGNHATLVNGPTYSSADGGAIDFDGTNDHATASLLMPSRPYTASVWINHDSLSLFFQYYLNQLYSSSSTNYGFSLFREPPFGSLRYKVNFRDRISNSGGTELKSTRGTTAMSIGNWFNLCGVASTTDFKLYVNGTLERTTTNSTARAGSFGSLFIGNTGSSYHFNGKMSSVLIYNTALSATEVTQNFDAVKSRYGL